MQSYISRRKRWWTRIRELDSSFNVYETLLADYLLDDAGLTKDQRLMILTVTGNVRTQSAIEDALRKQHSRTHESEGSSGFTSRTSAPSTGADWGGRSKGRFGRRSSGNPRRKTAFVAEGEEEDDDDDEEDEEEEEEDNQPVCYTCVTSGEDQDFENVKDRIEIDVVTAFICAGHDVEDEIVCREMANCAQNEAFAFMSRESAAKRGVMIDRRVHNYRPTSELSLVDRRDKVKKAKQNSTCRRCGKSGHWAGDPECSQKDRDDGGKGKGKGKKYKKFNGSVGLMAVGQEEEFDHCAPTEYIGPLHARWITMPKIAEEETAAFTAVSSPILDPGVRSCPTTAQDQDDYRSCPTTESGYGRFKSRLVAPGFLSIDEGQFDFDH